MHIHSLKEGAHILESQEFSEEIIRDTFHTYQHETEKAIIYTKEWENPGDFLRIPNQSLHHARSKVKEPGTTDDTREINRFLFDKKSVEIITPRDVREDFFTL